MICERVRQAWQVDRLVRTSFVPVHREDESEGILI